jgi:hypothetical protein
MADAKISALTALTGVNVAPATDVLPIVDTSVTTTKKITVEELRIGIAATQNSKSVNYTTVMSDAGGQILHPTADNNPRTFTIDSNANVPYPINTALIIVNQMNTVTVAVTSDSMTLAGAGTTGSRTLAAPGIFIAVKVGTTAWICGGIGVT